MTEIDRPPEQLTHVAHSHGCHPAPNPLSRLGSPTSPCAASELRPRRLLLPQSQTRAQDAGGQAARGISDTWRMIQSQMSVRATRPQEERRKPSFLEERLSLCI